MNTGDGLLAIDRQQRIVSWNASAESLLGYAGREALGKHCYDVLCGQDESGRPVCHKSCLDFQMAKRGEPIPAHEFLVRRRADREVWVSVSTLLPPSRMRSEFVLAHLFRDASGYRAMARFIGQLHSSLREVSGFQITDLSHDCPPVSRVSALTAREREVLQLLISGASTQAIAARLRIRPSTARHHIQGVLVKLGAHSRLEAVLHAMADHTPQARNPACPGSQ